MSKVILPTLLIGLVLLGRYLPVQETQPADKAWFAVGGAVIYGVAAVYFFLHSKWPHKSEDEWV